MKIKYELSFSMHSDCLDYWNHKMFGRDFGLCIVARETRHHSLKGRIFVVVIKIELELISSKNQ